MPVTLSLVNTEEQFAALAQEWPRLAGDLPFVGWDWCELWWRNYRLPHYELFLLTVRDRAGNLVGLAPWYVERTFSGGRVARFLGSNEVCGDRLTILATPERRDRVVAVIAAYLAGEGRHAWDLLELTGVEQGDTSINLLCDELSARGHMTHRRPDESAWRIRFEGDWETYLKTISRARRSRTKKILKRAVDAGRAVQHLVRTPEEFERAFAILEELHQKRRQSLGQPGCFASARYKQFHRAFALRMLEQNRLRLAWTELEGRPAAIEHNFLGDRTIYNYQSGFEPDLDAEHPGWLNLAITLKWATSSGYHTFDMLRGNEPYKASFGADPTPLVQIRIAGRKPSARARHVAWCAQAKIKRWTKRMLGMTHAAPTPSDDKETEQD